MKRNTLIITILILAAFSGCAQTEEQPITPTLTPVPAPVLNYSPVATGKEESLNLKLELNVGRNSFSMGETIKAVLRLENTGSEEISIEYFPNMPFNVFLYDKDGNLLETFRGERGASMASSAVLVLKPGEMFSGMLNVSINRQQGVYQLTGGFVGKPIDIEVLKKESALVMTEKIAVNIA